MSVQIKLERNQELVTEARGWIQLPCRGRLSLARRYNAVVVDHRPRVA